MFSTADEDLDCPDLPSETESYVSSMLPKVPLTRGSFPAGKIVRKWAWGKRSPE